jgi:hypothetical protein
MQKRPMNNTSYRIVGGGLKSCVDVEQQDMATLLPKQWLSGQVRPNCMRSTSFRLPPSS